MKRILNSSVPFFLAMSVYSCGKDSDGGSSKLTPAKKAESEEQSGSQLQDLSEAVSAVEANSVSLSLNGTTTTDKEAIEPVRECTASTANDGKVTVTETRKGTTESENSAGKLTRKSTFTVDSVQTNVWSPATGKAALECSTTIKAAKINWLSADVVNGLTLDMTIKGNRTAAISISGTTKKGVAQTLSLSRTFTADGTRKVVHSDHASTDAALSFVRTVTSKVVRKTSGTRRAAGSLTQTENYTSESTNSTLDGAPLKIKTEISVADKKWTKKTVQSGTTVSKGSADGNRVESTFSNVVFEAGNCIPVSGTVSGKIFPVDAPADATPTSTFLVTFGADTDSSVSIAYDGGTATDFPTAPDYLQGCNFSSALKAASAK